MKYRVTLPEGRGRITLWGLGAFKEGEPREVDLSPEQADSLRHKKLRLEKVAKPIKAEPITEPEPTEGETE